MSTGYRNTRQRVLIILEMLRDSKDGLTVKQIRQKLYDEYNLITDRKTIYQDLYAIEFLYPIIRKKQATTYYSIEVNNDTLRNKSNP